MADDPTVQFSLRRTRECPTCGHHPQLGESECSLCGTTLPRDLFPLVSPQDTSEPTIVAPLSAGPSDGTGGAPVPPRPPREETIKVVPQPPPPSPSPAPRLAPVVARLEPSQGERSTRQPASLQSTSRTSNLLSGWGGLAVGALALLFLSFFTAKMFFPSRETKDGGVRPPGPIVENGPGENTVGAKSQKPNESAGPLTPAAPPSQPVGQVTTADQLLPIRIFGADPNDELRGLAAFRAQVERGLQGIRDAYNAQIVGNPQSFGSVVLELSVAPEGQVTTATVHVTGNISRDLQQAIVNIVKDWRFSPTQGEEVKMFYPLFLSSEKIDPATFVSHFKEVWPGRYKVLGATPISVRAEANDGALELGTIKPGLFLSVVSSQDGWLGALSPKGKVGYLRREAISPRAEESPTATEAKG